MLVWLAVIVEGLQVVRFAVNTVWVIPQGKFWFGPKLGQFWEKTNMALIESRNARLIFFFNFINQVLSKVNAYFIQHFHKNLKSALYLLKSCVYWVKKNLDAFWLSFFCIKKGVGKQTHTFKSLAQKVIFICLK